MRSIKESIKLASVGAAMGIAEAIPGVSGGTIAFIFRIYQELLNTIKSFNSTNISLLLRGRIKEFFNNVNGTFLVVLLGGMVTGIIAGVFVISYLIEHHKEALWAFFFGLVVASSIYLAKDVDWNVKHIVIFILGAFISFGITLISPTTGSSNIFFIFFCGVVAISALMLPGLSGSFILLLLGMYSTVIGSLKGLLSNPAFSQDFFVVVVFGLGCLVGLFTFSRVLSYTFKNHFQPTMALMIGILIGSLNKLWPWKIPTQIFDKDSGVIMAWDEAQDLGLHHFEVIKESNLFPSSYASYGEPELELTILSLIIGLTLIGIIHLSDKKTDSNEQ